MKCSQKVQGKIKILDFKFTMSMATNSRSNNNMQINRTIEFIFTKFFINFNNIIINFQILS